MFSKNSLQQLKERIDLIDLIGSYLPLKRTGHVYKACCPFHEEKTPSFQVQAGAQHYHCFGCGAHGDAFSFVMHQAGLSFVDAARLIADRYHVILEEQRDPQEDHERSRMTDLMRQAQCFFVWCLWNHPEAQAARIYLQERGLGEDFCRRFGLGYCPGPRQELRDYLRSLRFRDEEMEKMGLVTASKPSRDFFTHRITFPIADYRFQPIAFSARKYLESTFGGKYINSPETLLFKKSKTLFGLPYSRARIAKENRAIIVEGQIDTLRMIEAGFNFTVAALGTAFGVDHVAQLKKLGVKTVWLLFDADAAGKEAAAKVGHLFMKESIEVRVAQLAAGEDPDTALSRDSGVNYIAERLDSAPGYVDFLANYRSHGKDLRSPAAKTALIESIKEQIESWQQPLLVYEGLRALARAFCVPENLVVGNNRPVHHVSSKRAISSQSSLHPPKNLLQDSIGGGWLNQHAGLEADLLRWLLLAGPSCPDLIRYCHDHIQAGDFTVPIYSELWACIMQRYQNKQPALGFASAFLELDSSLSSCIQELGNKRLDLKKMDIQVQHTVQEIVKRRIMHQAEQLRLEIQSAQLSDEEAILKAQEYANLRKCIPQVPPFQSALNVAKVHSQ